MTNRTAEIIMALKGNYKFKTDGSYRDTLVSYMSNITRYPKKDYTDGMIASIIQECVLDFISTCDNPRLFMFDYFDVYNRERNCSIINRETIDEHKLMINAFMSALQNCRVWNDGKLLNGFTEEMFAKWEKDDSVIRLRKFPPHK
jgi:hypothetical protein